MAEIKSLLDDVIEQEIHGVESLESGSSEKSSAIRDLAMLHKLRIEEIKAQTEADEKRERREMDSDHTRDDAILKRQAREQMIDRGVRIGELMLPLICYGIWMNKGFKFEETGTFTSTTFKNLLSRFKPTKRG